MRIDLLFLFLLCMYVLFLIVTALLEQLRVYMLRTYYKGSKD